MLELLDQKAGVRVIRFGFGLHNGSPFVRLDLWHKAVRWRAGK
jgi:hypothetical protein